MNCSYTNSGTRRCTRTFPSRNRTFICRVAGSYPIAAKTRDTTGVIVMVNGGSPCFEKVRVEATNSKRGANPHHFCRGAQINAPGGA